MLSKYKISQIFLSFMMISMMILSSVSPVVAQGGDGVKRQVNAESGRISFIGPESGRALSASKALGTFIRPLDPALALAKRFGPEFGLANPERDLTFMNSDQSADGRLVTRFQQTYNGIPVMGGELIVNTNNKGDLYSMSGEISPKLSLITTPTIDSAQAAETVLHAMAKWYQASAEDFVVSEPELWIYDESLLQPSTKPVELVWRMEVTSTDQSLPLRELVLVDAHRGGISLHFNQVDTAWASSSKESKLQEPALSNSVMTPGNTDVANGNSSTHSSGEYSPNLLVATWYVATTGDDTNDCATTSTPCATINGAIGKATSGDTIYVATGTYTSSGTQVALIDKDITLSGGWDAGFTTQSGFSTIDGQGSRRGITVDTGVTATLGFMDITNGLSSGGGSGILNLGNITVYNGSIRNGNATTSNSGGGIKNNGTLVLSYTTVINNTGNFGGGISNFGNATINNTTIIGNTTWGGSGSGISNSGTLIMTNSTISGNPKGVGSGGGIANVGSGTLEIVNSTIVFNEGSYTGGILNQGGDVILHNSILAKNGFNGADSDCYGTISSLGYNLIGNNSGCAFISTTGDKINLNAMLGELIGSPAYHPLLLGSPAINAGNPANCLSTDQRGVARPQGSICDIGAYEYTVPGIPHSLTILSGTPQSAHITQKFSLPLQVFVLDSIGTPVNNVAVTFSSPTSGASGFFLLGGGTEANATTNGSGIAKVNFRANQTVGSYTVTAATSGVGSVANFLLTNLSVVFTPLANTYTANNGTTLPGAFLCNQSQPNCTNGGDPHADAAHKYALGTYDLYAAKHSRDSIDNAGMTIISSVHYSSGFANAFWDGTQMVYGDYYGFPLADDVVAHELTHGVTQYESNLFYYYQSGAINESFSDLWGEYYDQTNGQGNDTAGVKWLMGEDVSGAGAIRSMSNPPAYGDPDKMSSIYYYEGSGDNGGVHYNSGVNNKAVYLMVDGGTFNGKTVTALGWEKTGAIYYEVQTNLLVSGSDYSDLYYALQQACTNLIGQHGISSGDCMEVKDALDAVEMNGQPAPNFNTHAPMCTTFGTIPNITFSDDLESGASNWTFNNGAYTRWQYDSPYDPYASSGEHFLYADDYPEAITDATAQLASFVVPENGYLHFSHAYGFEWATISGTAYYFDGGVLEYSTNGGSTWVDAGSLMTHNGYDSSIYNGWNNPLKGRSAFVGDSHGYISTRVDLSSLAGQTVAFRWRMGLDDTAFSFGWWLDDIQVYTCVTNWTISGNVGQPGVTLDYGDGTVTSGADGSYSITVPPGWSGTVTPTHDCFTFSPTSRNYSNVAEDHLNHDYTPTAIPNAVCVMSITRAGPDPTNAASVDFTVTFSEAVTGVDMADFALTTTGVTGASVTSVTDSGDQTSYTVTVDTGSDNGTVRLDVTDDDTIQDLSANPLGGAGAGNGDFTNGEKYTILKVSSFGDVPTTHPYFQYIEILYANGYTGGCSITPLLYCPDTIMNRAQSAVFMLRGNFGASYTPGPPTGFFKDNWSQAVWAEGWAESMFNEGLTAGCVVSPRKFCPYDQLTNVQAAVFGLRLMHGMSYLPPTGTGTVFADMTDPAFWGTGWAEQAYADGIIPSCGTDAGTGKPKFCPNSLVSRGFGAYVIVVSKDLTLP